MRLMHSMGVTFISLRNKGLHSKHSVWTICILVLTKSGLINNYLMLLICNIVLFSNILKTILCIISNRNQNKIKIFLYVFVSSFVSLSSLIKYLICIICISLKL